jgi:hypothetical protein
MTQQRDARSISGARTAVQRLPGFLRRTLPGVTALIILAACSNSAEPKVDEPRTYRLGFSATSPVLTIESILETIDAWRPHADIALVMPTVPWRALLADTSASHLVRRELYDLVALYRSRSLPIIVQLDVTDGLAREREAAELVELGRSITEPAVQAVYREYLLAIDSILAPEYLGLAMEVNLVRVAAPQAVYDAVVQLANSGSEALALQGSDAELFVSFQVETAWGRLGDNRYLGLETELADFAFIDVVGLSSYPFLAGFDDPDAVPLDYYSRITDEAGVGGLVVEGGWSSASVPGVSSSPDKQARWIRRQMRLSDHARLLAVTQITFTDLDLSGYPLPPESILPLFAHLGLVDVALQAKPALAEWQKAFSRGLSQELPQ